MGSVKNLRISCGKYIYGAGAVQHLGNEIKRLGGHPYIVGGSRALRALERYFDLQSIGICPKIHNGSPPTREAAKRVAEDALAQNCSVLVAIGGGRCMDLMKCASIYAKLPIITVPTSAATCAACAVLCVMYKEDGTPGGGEFKDSEIDVVIADTDIIATSPPRLLASGMFDAMAKYPEVIQGSKDINIGSCSIEKYISVANAKIIYDFILENAKKAYDDGKNFPRYQDILSTAFLETGLVSGFSMGEGQQALAHGIYDFMCQYFTKESEQFLHGEIVAIGVIIQKSFNGDSREDIETFISALQSVNMPYKLTQISFVDTPDTREKLVKFLVDAGRLDENKRDRFEAALTWVL